MAGKPQDPRQSVRYARMNDIIDLLEQEGPHTLENIQYELGLTGQEFQLARYSLPGQMAMEDRGVVIPRPVAAEGYVYKLADAFHTGPVEGDGEPNIQSASSDLLTRMATIYTDVDGLIAHVTGRAVRKLLRKLQRSLEQVIDRAEDVTQEVGAPISTRAQYVLDKIA